MNGTPVHDAITRCEKSHVWKALDGDARVIYLARVVIGDAKVIALGVVLDDDDDLRDALFGLLSMRYLEEQDDDEPLHLLSDVLGFEVEERDE